MNNKDSNIIALLLLLPLLLFSQKDYKESYLTPEEGLSYRWVMSIHQDAKGYMWIGTYNGLNRYDGYEFVTYQEQRDDSTALAGNVINNIIEDKAGQIWIAFNDNKTQKCIYQTATQNFKKVEGGKAFVQLEPATNRVIGREWLPYLPELEAFYYPKTTPIDSFPSFLKPIQTQEQIENTVIQVVKKGVNDIWIWMQNGTYIHYQVDSKKWTLHDLKKSDDYQIVHPYYAIDAARRFWYPSLEVVNRFDYFEVPTNIPIEDWTNVQLDNQHNIWFWSRQLDLCKYDVQKKEVKYLGKSPNASHVFYIDQANNTWIGGETGIKQLTSKKQLFENYWNTSFDLEGIQPIGISARNMVELEDGRILMQDQKGRRLFLMGETNYDPIRLPIDLLRSHGYICNLVGGVNNQVWVNLCGKGLAQYDVNTKNIEIFDIPNNDILTVLDNQQKIWKATKTPNTDKWQIGFFDIASQQYTFINEYTGSIGYGYFQADKNILWAAHEEGLIKINTLNNDIQYIDLKNFKEANLFRAYSSVWCILEWQSSLWLGTGEGLMQFDPNREQVINHFTINDGLPDNRIFTLQASDKHLWLGTQFGLCRFNPKDHSTKVYYVEDGLTHNEFNRFSSLKTKDGKMWFGGLNGVNAFYPADFEKYDQPTADLVWTKFMTSNLENEEMLTQDLYNLKDSLHFIIPPNQNEFRLQFALLDFISPNNNQYYWYLEGLEKPWSQVSKQPVAKYLNVPPGNYNLYVKATDHQGNPARNELVTTVSVIQVWYKRWWAFVVYALLTVAGIFLIYRFQLARSLEKREALRLKEMDTLKTRLYTNITHEFRTPLTVILGMTKQLAGSGRRFIEDSRQILSRQSGRAVGKEQRKALTELEGEMEEKLGLIERNGQNLLGLINQMLDLSKLESGRMALNLEQGDIIQYLNYIAESFHSFAKGKDLQIHFLPKVARLEMDFDKDKVGHILSNILSNAIKFTPNGGHIYLTSELASNSKKDKQQLLIEIRDTGVGIPESDLPHIFDRFYQADGSSTRKGEGTGIGLALVKEMVKLMEGDIQVKSTVGRGTAFAIQIPITQMAKPIADSTNEMSIPLPVPTSTMTLESSVSDQSDAPLVLLIEDNVDVAHYIQSCLKNNYQVLYAENGRIGIEKALEHIPDLVISDVMMPEKDGFEVCQTLKSDEKTSHIPIVLLTAKADITSKIEGLRHGADAYLAKPFNPEELEVRLQKLIALRQQLLTKYANFPIASPSVTASSPVSKKKKSSKPSKDELEAIFLQKVQNTIEPNIGDNRFNKQKLAQQLNMSETQLYRKLKALTGKSTGLYLRSVRLHKGKELLLSTQLTVAEVAYEVGFTDPHYFSRTFGKEFGMPPSEVRG